MVTIDLRILFFIFALLAIFYPAIAKADRRWTIGYHVGMLSAGALFLVIWMSNWLLTGGYYKFLGTLF